MALPLPQPGDTNWFEDVGERPNPPSSSGISIGGIAVDKSRVRYSSSAGNLVYSKTAFIDAGDFFADAGVVAGGDITAPLQAAVNAAIAANVELVIPSPATTGSSWIVSNTITITPAAGNSTNLSIRAVGPYFTILWAGGNGTASAMKAVFKSVGWKRASIRDLQVRLPGAAQYVVAFDVDCTSAYSSSGVLNIENVHVSASGATTGCIGWRLGHTGQAGASGSEQSIMTWTDCLVEWENGSTGSRGWVNEHINGLNHVWVNCSGVHCSEVWSTAPSTGAGDLSGGASLYFYGCASTSSDLIWRFTCGGSYGVWGGRHELGKRLMTINPSSPVSSVSVAIDGLLIADFTPSDGTLVAIATTATVAMRDNYIQAPSGAKYNASMITMTTYATWEGFLLLENNSIGATDPCWTAGTGTWHVTALSNQKQTVGGVGDNPDGPGFSAGAFKNRIGDALVINGALSSTNAVPITAVAASATLIGAEAFGAVHSTGTSAITLTVPPNSTEPFAGPGTTIEVVQYGAGQVAIAPGAGVTIRTAASLTSRAQYSSITLRKLDTNEWLVTGDLT